MCNRLYDNSMTADGCGFYGLRLHIVPEFDHGTAADHCSSLENALTTKRIELGFDTISVPPCGHHAGLTDVLVKF